MDEDIKYLSRLNYAQLGFITLGIIIIGLTLLLLV